MNDVEIQYTNYVPENIIGELDNKIKTVIEFFPELWDNTIKVGHTSTDIGRYISLNEGEGITYTRLYKGVSLHTIAHEFMHRVQHIDDDLPSGERPCELWTLARDPSILDEPPMAYLSVPTKIKNDWERWRFKVHKLAKEAIEERENGRRCYIKWFEDGLVELI